MPSGEACARNTLHDVDVDDNVHVEDTLTISPVLSSSLSLLSKTNCAGVMTFKFMLVSFVMNADAMEISNIPPKPDVVLGISINRIPDGYSALMVLR